MQKTSIILCIPCQVFECLRAKHGHNTSVHRQRYGPLQWHWQELHRPSQIPKQNHPSAIFRIQFLDAPRHHGRHKQFVCQELLWPEVNHFHGMRDQRKWCIHQRLGRHERPHCRGMDPRRYMIANRSLQLKIYGKMEVFKF